MANEEARGVSGKVECSACTATVETQDSFALPEEWATELGWTHNILTDWMCPDHCLFRPGQPNWVCRLEPGHPGRHRFRNYTISRWPHVHSGIKIVARAWLRHKRREIRHLIKYHKWPRVDLRPAYRLHWQNSLWPAKYEPLTSDGKPKP